MRATLAAGALAGAIRLVVASPAAGTGIDRLLTDVQRLAEHAGRWRATENFSAASLGSFYHDPIKRGADLKAIHDAQFRRGIVAEPGLIWSLQRGKVWLRQYAENMLQVVRESVVPHSTHVPSLLPSRALSAPPR